MTLTAGVLDAATNNVNLIFQTGNAPIDRTNGTLTPFAGGFLQFGSAGNTGGSAFVIPNNTFTSAPVLNNLIINRTNALTLGNQNITLNGTLTLTAGILDIGNTTLTFQTGNTPVSITAGSLTTGSAASLQFGTAGNTTGAAFTLPNNLFTAAPTLNNLTVNRTNALTLGTQAITVGGVLTLTSGALNIGNGTLGLNGTLSLTAGILNGGATSNLSVGGSGANLTLPSTVTTLNNLTVARPNAGAVPAVTLAGALAISGGINLSGGSLSLGANNLTLSPAATIANFTASRYIITANTPASGGFLIRNAGATATFFPVGTGSYTPLTINNAGGTADNFRVRVFDGLLSGGTSGSTDANINHAVNKTWVVEEATTGGSAATITAQWNTTDENASFARNASLVAQHDGTAWGSSSTGAAATNVSAGVWSRSVPNVTSFSSFSVQDVLGTPLPIKWLAFTAVRQGTTVQLRWLAQSSDPNYWFEIERSGDNLNFEHIGAVQGQGLDGLAVYTLADNTPLMCTKSFYRIRQVSTTGASAYSPVRVVDGERGEALSLQLYPLPAKEVVYVHFNCSESNKAVIAVIDAAGNTVQRQTVTVVKGINLFEISVNDLPQGLYILTLRLGKDSYRAKLMK